MTLSITYFLVAASAFFLAIYFGRGARSSGDSDVVGRSLLMSLPFLIIGFAFLYLGWRQLG